MSMSAPDNTESSIAAYDKIKTHFPAARIKKLMQSDEEIGKVAQATPVVVGKALEIFLCDLVSKSCSEANSAGTKRISVDHLRAAVKNNEQFDFLEEVVSGSK